LRTVLCCTKLLLWLGLIVTPLFEAVPAPAAQRTDADSVRQVVNAAVAAVKPALVRIYVVSVDYRQGREVKEEAVGSGVIISEQGYVITNHHVAGHAKQITCTMADKTEIEAELVGTDPLTDIAVIKLLPDEKQRFPVAKFGDSSAMRVGDGVLAMGSPLAFSQSVTMGVVSNTELVMPYMSSWFRPTLDGEHVGSIVRWIAHDADIYPGNSGGPLVNMQGEIIGINEIKLGLGGAIPGNLAREVAEQLIKRGKVKRSWLGITIQPLLKSSERKDGVLISGTIEDSPGQKAGFLPGDILIRLAGKDCSVRFAEELPLFNQLVMGLPTGKEIEAVVLRGGKEVSLKVTPIDREKAREEPQEFKRWGICASNITFFAAKEMKRAGTLGVLVTTVRPGGPCGDAKPRIARHDVIVEVAEKPVENLDDLRRVTEEIAAGKKDPVPTIVAFERDVDRYLTVVKVGIQEMKDPGLEVRKAWLPAGVQVLTRDIAKALGLEGRTGVRVTQVYPNSAIEKADLKVGDIIVALDGMPIPASQPEDIELLPAMIRQYRIGSTAELTVLRDGQEHKTHIELPQVPKLPREMKKYRDNNFDFTVRDVAFLDRIEEQWPQDQDGVLVESAAEGGWASLGRLSIGDLIVSVDGQAVQDVASFKKVMEGIADRKPKTTVLQVKRGIYDVYIELVASWPSN